MKKVKSLAFALSVMLIYANGFSQGLNSITTPDGVNVVAVGDLGKIYRSTTAGATWGSYTYSSDNLNHVASFGNDVWIAGSVGNVYKTSKVISPVQSYNVGENFRINSVCFISSDIGYVCGDGGRIYTTINGGANWTSASSGIGTEDLNGISFVDDQKGVVVGDNGVIYLTENGGSSWTLQQSGTQRNLLKSKYFADGIIVVGEWGTIVTKEGAGEWQSVATRTRSDIRAVTGASFAGARVCGGGGFIRNNLNGRTNFFNFEINPMLANLVDICYYGSTTGFAVSSLNYAIIRTTNGGTSWELPAGSNVSFNWVAKSPSSSGIGNNLCMHPHDRNTAFVVYGNRVFVSRDRGDNWTQIATISIGSRAHSFYVTPLDTNVWVAAIESTPDRVVRSTDYGATWTSIVELNFSSYGQPLEMDQNRPGVFYYAPDGTTTGFFKSTDNGATFTSVSNNNPFTSPCDIIVMWDSSDVMFVGDNGADIFKTSDNGATWTLVKPNSSSEVPSMCNTVFDPTLCYATTWSSNEVYRTVNSGDAWSVASVNSGSGWGSDMCHEDPTVVLTGNYGSQAYLSTNNGATFFNVNTGLGGAGAGIMVPERGWMLNMQTSTLYKLNITYSMLTTAEENLLSNNADSYELLQNYPNPFNPSTTISYSIPRAGDVTLRVYDRLGKEVASLSEGFRSAGSYEVIFDASSLSSGIYFYTLTTEGFTSTRKMVLVK